MPEIETLKSLRKRLVDERRRVASLGIEAANRPESWAASLKSVQELIEAVDRAIADEETLVPSVYERQL